MAAGTLVQTIPCVAKTSDRVAKFLPVMRSICASKDKAEPDRKQCKYQWLNPAHPEINALQLKSALEFWAAGYI